MKLLTSALSPGNSALLDAKIHIFQGGSLLWGSITLVATGSCRSTVLSI